MNSCCPSLFEAASNGHSVCTLALISAKHNLNQLVKTDDHMGTPVFETPLSIALKHNRGSVADILLDAGANPNIPVQFGISKTFVQCVVCFLIMPSIDVGGISYYHSDVIILDSIYRLLSGKVRFKHFIFVDVGNEKIITSYISVVSMYSRASDIVIALLYDLTC